MHDHTITIFVSSGIKSCSIGCTETAAVASLISSLVTALIVVSVAICVVNYCVKKSNSTGQQTREAGVCEIVEDDK